VEILLTAAILALGASFGVPFWLASIRLRQFRRALEVTAAPLGLEVERGGLYRSPRLHGLVEDSPGGHHGLSVDVAWRRQADRNGNFRLCTRLAVASPGLPPSLSMRSAAFGRGATELGDPDFDADVVVASPDPDDALSRLPARARSLAGVLVGEHQAQVHDGAVYLTVPTLMTRPAELQEALGATLELAALLARRDLPEADALVDLVLSDPVGEIRRRALTALAKRHPGSAALAAAARAAVTSPDAALRVLAAEHHDGPESLTAARDVAVDERADAPLRARAVEVLGRSASTARPAVAETVDSILTAGAPDPVLAAALHTSAAIVHLPPLDALKAATPQAGASSGPMLARALARHGPRAEGPLMTLLETSASETRVAAAHALGEVGTFRAVPPLRSLSGGLFRHRGLRDAARGAVAAIEARGGGAESGRLSMIGEGGELALLPEGAPTPRVPDEDETAT